MPAPRSSRSVAAAIGALAAPALVAGAAAPAHADPAVDLRASVSAPLVTLPIGDGYRDDESIAVTASAAATASVTLQREGGTADVLDPALALEAGTTSITVPTTGLVAGGYTATVSATDGATTSASFTVEPLHAVVTRLTVSRSVGTVFPARDGYRDSVVFTVVPTVSGPSSATVTGTAKLARAGRTAKTWKLHGGTNRLTWNGKAGARVKPGAYTLTVTAKGPQGAARTARTTVRVSAKHLVSRTVTVTKQASSALQRFQPYDADERGTCGHRGALVGCTGYTAANGAASSVVVGGTVGLPKAVRAATAYAKPQLRVAVHTTKLVGSAEWGSAVGTARTTGALRVGTATGRWIRWSANPAKATVVIGLGDDSTIILDRITYTYRYRALV